jgi:hypothetical protein
LLTPGRKMSATAKNVVSRWLSATAKAVWVRGGQRKEYLDAVWEMYSTSYAKIGLHVSGPSGLLAYDLWELFLDGDIPVAFNLYKSTAFGLKTGLLGSDGSGEAKTLIKAHIKNRYKRGGVYGEVSHAVERIAQGAPAVCAVNAPKVLNKPVVPEDDGVHYKRALKGVGMVTKKLIGTPKGVPSGPESACSVPEVAGEPATPGEAQPRTAEQVRIAEELDAAEHAGCQLFDED